MAPAPSASSTTVASTGSDQRSAHTDKTQHGEGEVEKVYSKTEADILPVTTIEPAKSDLESGQVDGEKPAIPSMTDPSSFPDGGWEAWLVVLGGFCCLFCSFGWINCVGVFQDYYQTHQLRNLSSSTVAWISSLEIFMMFVGGPFLGKIYDNYGPRYILLFGSILHVFGLMMASISTEYYQFILAQGICSPLGASAIFYPAMSTTGTWFFKRRAAAYGVMASGSSLGGVIFPIMVERLVGQVGFGWTMRICAFLIAFLLIIANLTVKSRIPPSPKPLDLMEFVRPLTEATYLLVAVGCFLFFFGLFLPFNFIILQARERGMSSNLAGYLIPILNAASIFGRTIPGYFADKVGRFNVMIVTTYVSAILVFALWIPAKTNAPIITFAALYGFSSGAFVSMAPALVAQFSDIKKIGVRNGTLFAIISVAALVGNPIAGALIAQENGFLHLQVFCGALLMAGSTGFVFARSSIVGWAARKKV